MTIALEFRTNREGKLKLFWALQKDRNTPSEQLALLLHEDMTDHQMMQNKQVKIRVQAQRLIQPDEWEEIRKSALKTAQKVFEGRQQVIRDWNDKRLRIEAKGEKAIKELNRQTRKIMLFLSPHTQK